MKILGHIHTLNDEEVIDRSIRALLDQTFPVDEILVVDNASTDGTLRRSFPNLVTVIRHPGNRGTSGAVATGFEYALAKHYDWIWLFDADSAPREEALEKLVSLYRGFSQDLQARTWLLASLPIETRTGQAWHGAIFTPRGPKAVVPKPGERFYELHVSIWTGSLFKLAAVRQVGMPRVDYMLDTGEGEYMYRGLRAGYRAFLDQESIAYHNIRARPPKVLSRRFGPVTVRLVEFPEIRWYSACRNIVYFWLHEYHERRFYHTMRELSGWVVPFLKLLLLSRWSDARACVVGLWDGLRKSKRHRYLSAVNQ